MIRQLFCSHKYLSHAKEKYEWKEKVVNPDTKYWITPIVELQEISKVCEVLICEKCGKITQIEY